MLIMGLKNFFTLSFVTFLLLTTIGCSSDNDERVEYDSGNDVSFYDKIPNMSEELGYWYYDKFIELVPQSESPFRLLVVCPDVKGKTALKSIAAKGDGIVFDEVQLDKNGMCYVETNKYFESSNFYVSASYKPMTSSDDQYNIQILPLILVKPMEGKDCQGILNAYSGLLTLDEVKDKIGFLACHVKSSSEVLRMASEINSRDDVDWAEPNKIGEIVPFER